MTIMDSLAGVGLVAEGSTKTIRRTAPYSVLQHARRRRRSSAIGGAAIIVVLLFLFLPATLALMPSTEGPVITRILQQQQQRSFQSSTDTMEASARRRRMPPNRYPSCNYSYNHHGTHLCSSVSPNNSNNNNKEAFMKTALAIVPPDQAWDNLQRARHVARDRSYTRWPPCIRLFHPFCAPHQQQDVALRIAAVIEKYNIEPFTIHLSQWMVIPHTEAMEADWHAMQQMPDHTDAASFDNHYGASSSTRNHPDEQSEIDQLIAREEIAGRKNRRTRQKRAKALAEQRAAAAAGDGNNMTRTDTSSDTPGASTDEATSTSTTTSSTKRTTNTSEPTESQSHRKLLEKQKRMYEEFNGPCVVCLEPDEESKEKLVQLRELLRRELFAEYDKYSPSSTVSEIHGNSLPRAVLESDEPIDFRPVVAIGSYPTVNSAIEMARKLRGVWEPLSFQVTDLHLISCVADDDQDPDGGVVSSSSLNTRNFDPAVSVQKTSWVSHGVGDEERSLHDDEQFGCDSVVMLMGEEVEMDQGLNQEMVNFVCEQGQAGGVGEEKQNQEVPAQKYPDWAIQLKEKNGNVEELAHWLDEDDEFDEGTVVVIGRTHFFTGEMRKYVGMPATSATDAKDRTSMGADGISGAGRRRGAVHRSGGLWDDQDWGKKDSDRYPKPRGNKKVDN